MGTAWRRLRGPLSTVSVTALVIAALVVAATAATGATNPAVAFRQAGHWVFNRAESSVVHVDSGTQRIDSRAAVPGVGADGLFALQGERQGFVVGRTEVTVFGKSDLNVEGTVPTGQSETPIGIEVVGGPYLVYRQAGTIVRLGTPPTSIQVGGRVDRPVATDDGAVLLRRPDTGSVCVLRRDAAALDCAPRTAPTAPGALTLAANLPAFLGTTDDRLSVLDDPAGRTAAVGVDLPDTALIGDRDTRGRLPVVVAPGVLVLVDTSSLADGHDGGPPVRVELGAGDYTAPVAGDGVVAVIEQTRNRLLTFAVDGRALGVVDLPPGGGPAAISRGEDGRLYVDDADGATTHVVGPDGTVTSVQTAAPVAGASAGPAGAVAPPAPTPPAAATPPRAPTSPGDTKPVRAPGPAPVEPENPAAGPPDEPAPNPPAEPPPRPEAPGGVRAVAEGDGRVSVSWRAVDGTDVRYDVLVDGDPTIRTSRRTAALGDLTPDREYTVTVRAVTVAGQGPESAPITVTPAQEVGPPTGLTAARRFESSPYVMVSWSAPDLNGARLVGYEVSANGAAEGGRFTRTVTESSMQDSRNYCSPTVRYQVRAVTAPAGGGPQTKGDPATATVSTPVNCLPPLVLDSATATGPDSVRVVYHCNGSGRGGRSGADVALTFNGSTAWSGECDTNFAEPPRHTADVDGLEPGTRYTVAGVASSVSGSERSRNTLTVTTPET